MIRRILAASLVLLTLSACSQQVAPPESRVQAPEETLTTLKVATIKNENRSDLDELIAAFQAKNAGYRIEIVQFDGDRTGRGRLEEAAMAGNVDIVVDGAVEPTRRSMVFRALDGFLAQSTLDQSRFGDLLDQVKLDGRVIQLPYTVYPQFLVYNKEMAAAANVNIPSTGWTWEEFRYALNKLTQGQGETKVWGLDTAWQEDFVYMYLQQKHKVPMWQANYEQLRDTLSYFHTLVAADQSLVKIDKVEISASGVGRNFSWWSLKSLNEQKAAMTYEMPMSLNWLSSGPKVPWAIAPMPAHPGTKPMLHVRPRTLGITFNTQKAEAAWKFVAFAAGPEGAEVMARAGEIPVYASEGAQKAWAAHKRPEALENIWNVRWVADLRGQSPNGYGLRHVEASKAIMWILSGQKSVEDAIGYFKGLE